MNTQCNIHEVLFNITLENCIILLVGVTPINLIKYISIQWEYKKIIANIC